MISIKEAIKLIEENLPEKQIVSLGIQDCFNLVLAEDIISPEPLPRFTNSAMDGFAVRWGDVLNASTHDPARLQIIGESRAGIPYDGIVETNTTVSISTGGMLPDGTDTIIPIEVTEIENNMVYIKSVTQKGDHVRYKGEEIEKGNILLKSGQKLNPACIGLLASTGIKSVKVYKKPDIAIITTGTELMPLDAELKPWQIRDSNSLMLKGAIIGSAANVVHTSTAVDNLETLISTISEAEANAEIIILSGGVSVGPHDFVKDAAKDLGYKELFWRVLQKPGKPLFYAKKGNKLLIGLPGNPVSALNCYAYYIHPIIQELLGKKFTWKTIEAELSEAVTNKGKRPNFQRFVIKENETGLNIAVPIEKLGSHMLTSIAYAVGFIIIEPDESLPANHKINIILYSWNN